jgi:retron-type reverse transcriptase
MRDNIVSPLLLNIYLTPLDSYVEDLVKQYHKRTKCKKKVKYQDIIHINYIRYADVFIIGVLAKKKLVLKLKNLISI